MSGCFARSVKPITVTLLVLGGWFGDAPGQQPIDVFVLAGQSNAIHRQPRGAAPLELRSQPTAYHSHYLRNAGGQLDQSPEPAPFVVGPGEGFGPELGLIAEFVDTYGSDRFAVIQSGWGGTSITGPWAAGDPFFEQEFIPFIEGSLDSLRSAAYEPTIRGFFWVQGENDAVDQQLATAYQANLEDFRQRTESSLGCGFYFGISTLHTQSPRHFAKELVAAQEAVAAASPEVGLIRPDDLLMNSDRVHYPASSTIEIGRRLARSYLSYDALHGDFDHDGTVGIDDYEHWRQNVGNLGGLWADANLDGFVDAADYTVWRDRYTPNATLVVPEFYASFMMLAVAPAINARRLR